MSKIQEYNSYRKQTREIYLKNLKIGGNNPVYVQSMTNTKTTDIKGTIDQINRCIENGVDIMRVSVPDMASVRSLSEIIKEVSIPIVADVHFNYRIGMEAAKSGASCIRINPGNVGGKHIKEIVKAVKDNDCAIRIGVNSGSLDKAILDKYIEPRPEAMVESAMNTIRILEEEDFQNIKISVKSSNVKLCIQAYEMLSKVTNYPLHVGVTESGSLKFGTVQSSIGIGNLLMNGIGDTIRVSLSDKPEEEVLVGLRILKSLYIRSESPMIISCPSCARQGFVVENIVKELEEKTENIKKKLTISILGCPVNGIGEAQHSDIGIVGLSNNIHDVYIAGKKECKINSNEIVSKVLEIINTQF